METTECPIKEQHVNVDSYNNVLKIYNLKSTMVEILISKLGMETKLGTGLLHTYIL